ncbi:MAG: nuclease [Arthrospira sp. SH-MAG29]|nr:nuclease [Arthrospira sp. SH-MAG29]MBS0016187.1 nuclease [Arthrospira sp. SH-MAG29]
MTNAQVVREQLSATDPASPSLRNPALLTRYDDYIIQPTFPNANISIAVDAFNTMQYDPIVKVFQLGSNDTAPFPGQSPIAANDDRALGNRNATIGPGQIEFGTGLGASSTLRSDGVSRYLVRVTSYDPLPDNSTFPPTGELPQDYQLAVSVDLGNLNPPDIANGGIFGPNEFASTPDVDPLTGVARFWDSEAGSHIFTADQTEKNTLASNPQRFVNEGFEFVSEGDTVLQRFRNSQGGFFYASNLGEINFVQTLQEWVPDNPGTSIRVFSSPVAGALPVFRAFNLDTNGHFYTIDPNQAAFANDLPNFIGQGVSFYARPIA